jgi:DNA replication protein DnaT
MAGKLVAEQDLMVQLALNQAELSALKQAISNDARVLYCLGIRPDADHTLGTSKPLNYKNLLALLNSKEDKYTLGRQLNSLLKELLSAGLIDFQQEADLKQSCNGKKLILPLVAIKADDYGNLHLNWQKIHLDWKPDDSLYADLATLVGIIDKNYDVTELGDFIAYWLGRPEVQFSQFQWTQKFVFNIKQKRLAKGVKPQHKVGNQLVTPKAGVVADHNAKQLVAKYRVQDKN